MRKSMEALSKCHYQKNKRNVGPKERGKKKTRWTHAWRRLVHAQSITPSIQT